MDKLGNYIYFFFDKIAYFEDIAIKKRNISIISRFRTVIFDQILHLRITTFD